MSSTQSKTTSDHKRDYVSYNPTVLVELRGQLKLSVQEVVARTGITRQTIHRLERRDVVNGKYPRAGLAVLKKLASAYRVPLKKILP